MDDISARILGNLADRLSGPLHLRVFMQPLMAILFAVRDGRRDARNGDVPYFWALFTDPNHRFDLLRSGWKSVGKVFIIALLIDAAYQYIQLRWFWPGEALIVATVLAIVPYVSLRGAVNRLTPRKATEKSHVSGALQ